MFVTFLVIKKIKFIYIPTYLFDNNNKLFISFDIRDDQRLDGGVNITTQIWVLTFLLVLIYISNITWFRNHFSDG